MDITQLKIITLNTIKCIFKNDDKKLKGEELSRDLFKQISFIFKCLTNIIKILISSVDNEKYKKQIENEIVFPNNIDTLILLLGVYDLAFDDESIQILFNIVSFDTYREFYTISHINLTMIDFIVDGSINSDKLKTDLLEFKDICKQFIIHALKIDSDFNYIQKNKI